MPLTKPYDPQALLEDLKAKELPVAETAVKAVVDSVFNWLSESVKLSATPFDNIAFSFLEQFKPQVMAELDKIDGKVG